MKHCGPPTAINPYTFVVRDSVRLKQFAKHCEITYTHASLP